MSATTLKLEYGCQLTCFLQEFLETAFSPCKISEFPTMEIKYLRNLEVLWGSLSIYMEYERTGSKTTVWFHTHWSSVCKVTFCKRNKLVSYTVCRTNSYPLLSSFSSWITFSFLEILPRKSVRSNPFSFSSRWIGPVDKTGCSQASLFRWKIVLGEHQNVCVWVCVYTQCCDQGPACPRALHQWPLPPSTFLLPLYGRKHTLWTPFSLFYLHFL